MTRPAPPPSHFDLSLLPRNMVLISLIFVYLLCIHFNFTNDLYLLQNNFYDIFLCKIAPPSPPPFDQKGLSIVKY